VFFINNVEADMLSGLLKQITSHIPEEELETYVRDVYLARSPIEALDRLGLALDEVILWWLDNNDYRMQIGEEASREIEEILRGVLRQNIYELLQEKYNQARNQKPVVQAKKNNPLQNVRVQHRQVRKKITTEEIITQVSDATDLEYSQVEVAFESILRVIKIHLSYGDEVQLPDFGTFTIRRRVHSRIASGSLDSVTRYLLLRYLSPEFKPSRSFFSRLEAHEGNQFTLAALIEREVSPGHSES